MALPKILHVCFEPPQSEGRYACEQLDQALRIYGHHSEIWYADPSTQIQSFLHIFRRRQQFSPITHSDCSFVTLAKEFDVIHVHGNDEVMVSDSILSKIGRPILWNIYNHWAITGGCLNPQTCTRYRTECHTCPQLESNRQQDASYLNFRKRLTQYLPQHITFNVFNPRVFRAVQKSALIKDQTVVQLPPLVDTEYWKPTSRYMARDFLHITQTIPVIGLINLTESLTQSIKAQIETQGHIVTATVSPQPFGNFLSSQDVIQRRLFYSAAQVVITDQVHIALEALSSGTPVVAASSALAGIIKHECNGYYPPNFTVAEILSGVQWAMQNSGRASIASRVDCLERFGSDNNSYQYIEQYNLLASLKLVS